jgi:hypothetical protein
MTPKLKDEDFIEKITTKYYQPNKSIPQNTVYGTITQFIDKLDKTKYKKEFQQLFLSPLMNDSVLTPEVLNSMKNIIDTKNKQPFLKQPFLNLQEKINDIIIKNNTVKRETLQTNMTNLFITNFEENEKEKSYPNIIFQFTRHLPSCNNLNLGGDFSFLKTGKDYDPASPIYGVIEAIKFSLKNEAVFRSSENSEPVYVSNLVRTWMTAVILYGIRDHTKDRLSCLRLCVSPYLKEETAQVLGHWGNQATNLTNAINSFIYFLIKIQYIYLIGDINVNDAGNVVKGDPNENPIKLPKKICIEIYNDTEKDTWFHKNIELTIPEMSNDTVTEIKNSKDNKALEKYINKTFPTKGFQSFTQPKFSDNILQAGKPYRSNGNLTLFMNWFTKNLNKKQKEKINNPVRVVTHSRVMRSYFKNVLDIDFEKKKIYNNVRTSNMWSFQTPNFSKLTNNLINKLKSNNSVDNMKKLVIDTILPGIPKENPNTIPIEIYYYKNLPKLLLCGYKKSKNQNGGKKTVRHPLRKKRVQNKTIRKK